MVICSNFVPLEQVLKHTYTEAEREELFNTEFLPSIRALYNFAFRLTLDSDDARDLVQETYLRAYRFIDSFTKGTNAKAWLFRILKNGFINDYRKKRREPAKVDYQEVEEYYNSEDTGKTITPDLRVDMLRNLIGDEISNALNSLDVEFKTVIILCDLEGFKYEEIAAACTVPVSC
jgi:RNA polymerase sigma factor (sigma-70 family)